jgi:hypothetical protein
MDRISSGVEPSEDSFTPLQRLAWVPAGAAVASFGELRGPRPGIPALQQIGWRVSASKTRSTAG